MLLNKLSKWLNDHGISSSVKKHPLFEQIELVERALVSEATFERLSEVMPQYQLVADGLHGSISAIMHRLLPTEEWNIEIYCVGGDLFEGIRRYATVEDAGKTILKLLNEGIFEEEVKRTFDVWNDFVYPMPEGTQEVDYSELERRREELEP